MKNRIIFLLAAALCTAGCYNDIEEELYGSCVTGQVTFTTVSQILAANGCLGCHSGSMPSGNIGLSTYTEVKARVQDGRLLGSINHAAGYVAMPQGAPKISTCEISKVKAWIDAGALNN